MPKMRLDILVADSGMAETRSQAQRLIMAGQVRVDGQVELRPGAQVSPTAMIQIDHGPRFVSRGGEKLDAAFVQFRWDVGGQICADIGSSTGGFTDCLLQHGAAKVYAIDVGYGLLHWKLRTDPRVISMERVNARNIQSLAEPVTRVTIDASFISLKIFLPVIRGWFPMQGGEVVCLIKPQFEAGKAAADRGEGVIQDPALHHQILEGVLNSALLKGYGVLGVIPSPLRGPKGNIEFLSWLTYPGVGSIDLQGIVTAVLGQIE